MVVADPRPNWGTGLGVGVAGPAAVLDVRTPKLRCQRLAPPSLTPGRRAQENPAGVNSSQEVVTCGRAGRGRGLPARATDWRAARPSSDAAQWAEAEVVWAWPLATPFALLRFLRIVSAETRRPDLCFAFRVTPCDTQELLWRCSGTIWEPGGRTRLCRVQANALPAVLPPRPIVWGLVGTPG